MRLSQFGIDSVCSVVLINFQDLDGCVVKDQTQNGIGAGMSYSFLLRALVEPFTHRAFFPKVDLSCLG